MRKHFWSWNEEEEEGEEGLPAATFLLRLRPLSLTTSPPPSSGIPAAENLLLIQRGEASDYEFLKGLG